MLCQETILRWFWAQMWGFLYPGAARVPCREEFNICAVCSQLFPAGSATAAHPRSHTKISTNHMVPLFRHISKMWSCQERTNREDTWQGYCWWCGWRCDLQRFSTGSGGALKGLQPTARMLWRDCGPPVTHTRAGTPLKSYRQQMIPLSSETFPKRLWLTENICQGRNFPKRWLPNPKSHWGTGKQEEKIGRRKTLGVKPQLQLPRLWWLCLWMVPEWNPTNSR